MDRQTGHVGRRRVLAGAAGGLALGVAGKAAGTRPDGDATRDHRGDDPLEDASGIVDVVVEFEEFHPPDDPAGEPASVALKQLKRWTADARERFEAATAEKPVEVEREFWLANAVLASVDADAVSVGELTELDLVEAVESSRRFADPREDNGVHEPIPTDGHGVHESSQAAGHSVHESSQAAGHSVHESSQTDGRAVHGAVETAAGPASLGSERAAATYGLEMVGAPILWEFHGTRGEGVDVAVVGTGVDPSNHEDIRESLERGGWAEFDESGDRVDNEPRDPDGHGTGISGVLVGETTDDGVQYGVAPDANLYVARRRRSYASTLAALEWVAESGAEVLSVSWGFLEYDGLLARAVENLRATGTLVVGSVGNAGRYTSAAVGNIPTTLGVGAVDRDRAVPAPSGGERIDTPRYWGDAARDGWPETYTVPDVTAPGVDLPIPEVDGGFRNSSGTSIATPLVAGAAALVLAATDAERATEVADLLVETALHPAARDRFAVDPGHDDRHGSGVVSAMHAASVRNATASVSGRVTDPEGNPIQDADVVAEAGPRTTTDADGRFALELPPGRQPVGAVAVGYQIGFDVFDPAERDRLDLTLEPTEGPDCALRGHFQTRIDPGETTTATLEVADVRTVSVTAETDGPIDEEHLSLSIDGQPTEFGEGATFDPPRDDSALDITIRADDGAPAGTVALPVYVGGDGDPIRGQLGTVHVHPDPLTVDPQVPSIEAVVDLVAPDTEVTLADGTYEEPVDGGAPGALVLDKPVSLVAARGASPEVVADGEADAAVFVTANDVRLAGLAVDAGGAAGGVRAGIGYQGSDSVGPSGLTVRGTELAGATHAVVTDVAPAARVEDNTVTADDVGIDVRDGETAIRGNDIGGTETGVRVTGSATEVVGNAVTDTAGVGIHVDTQTRSAWEMGPVADNLVDGADTGILVSGRTDSGIEANRLANVRGTAIGVTGRVGGAIRDNVVEGATVGLDLREGTVEGPVTGNEFRDVESERAEEGDPPPGTGGPNAAETPVDGRAPAESAADLLLYGATALSLGVLLLPYGLRRYWRR